MTHLPRHRLPRRWSALAALAVVALGSWALALSRLDPHPTASGALGKTASHSAAGPAPARGAVPAPTPSVTATGTATPGDSQAAPAGYTETTQTVTIGTVVRSYLSFMPVQPVATRIPVIVMLHGLAVTPSFESVRDSLLPLAASGQLVLVYPAGYLETWNGVSCCGSAMTAGIDDVDFIATLLHQEQAKPSISGIYLAGYSNGAKVAFRVACTDPSLITGLISVHGVPGTACLPGAPVTMLQVASTADPRVTYDSTTPAHIVGGFREQTVLAQVASWRSRDACSGAPAPASAGTLSLRTWTCSAGTRVELATYAGGDHTWPSGGNGTPPAAQVISDFIHAAA